MSATLIVVSAGNTFTLMGVSMFGICVSNHKLSYNNYVNPVKLPKKPRILNFIFANPAAFLLLLIIFAIAVKNYTPDTFLTGWDTLHPEFNYGLYLNRIINGVWQEHQGLGAVATQAHAAEIPRVAVLLLFDLVLKTAQVRYGYVFLTLILGPLGVYFFLRHTLKNFLNNKLHSTHSAMSFISPAELGAFAGALLYLLNYGTVQHYYVPLEMFLTQYAFLGWLLLYATKFLDSGQKNNLLIFSVLTFLSTPQSHTSTLFFAYFLALATYVCLYYLTTFFIYKIASKSAKNVQNGPLVKNSILLLLLTLLINSFWLFPNIYFAATHGEEIRESKIHQLFSEEAFLQNREFGNLKDTAQLKNFLFNWGEHVGNQKFGPLLNEWLSHELNPGVVEIGYVVFALSVLGLVLSIVRKSREGIAVAGIFFLALFFLLNVNSPVGFIFEFLQNKLPLFREALRFPFTKFSILFMFSLAVFFGYFLCFFSEFIDKFTQKLPVRIVLFGILYSLLLFSLLYRMLPIFSGGLISQSMRVKIPDRYFELFNYLNNLSYQPTTSNEPSAKYLYDGRIANFPVHSFWGWVYHNWDEKTNLGYQGAGFLWFGLKQPLLDREFDRWNLKNEQYFKEVSYAVYSQNVPLLESVLEKYQVKWLLVDESVIVINSDSKMLFYPELLALFDASDKIALKKDFGAGLKVYEFTPDRPYSQLYTVDAFSYIGDSIFKENTDDILRTSGGYYVSTPDTEDYFPTVGTTTFTEALDPHFIRSDNTAIYLTLPEGNYTRNTQNQDKALMAFTGPTQFDVLFQPGTTTMTFSLMNKLTGIENGYITIPARHIDNMAVRINGDILKLPTVEESAISTEPIGLGSVYLIPNEKVTSTLYTSAENTNFGIDYSAVLETCSDVDRGATYSVTHFANGFKLVSKSTDACVTTGLSNYFGDVSPVSDLVRISFDAKSEGSKPDLCVLDSVSGLCVNTPITKNNLEPGKTSFALINTATPENYLIRFLTYGENTTDAVGVTYENILVEAMNVAADNAPVVWEPVTSEPAFGSAITLAKDSDLAGPVVELNNRPRLCDGRSRSDKSFVLRSQAHLSYVSNGESLCDSFQFPFAKHSGYILEVKSRNVQGMPLRICLTNEVSKRCDLYVSLGYNSDFESQFFVVPPIGEGSGYTVNVSNLTFGTSTSVNDLQYVGLTPYPYWELRSLHEPFTKSTSNEKLLVYNQAFENGWLALCGFSICDAQHVLVNNWANGWVFNDYVDSTQVRVIFWPQYLEYIGFGLVFALFLWLILSMRKERKIKEKDGVGIVKRENHVLP